MSLFSRAYAREILLCMLAESSTTSNTQSEQDSVQAMRDLVERMQAELKFERTRNEALNFEIARLKRWRFGSSSESLEASAQAVLFDALLVDTAIEDRAAIEAAKPASATPLAKGKAIRQARSLSSQLSHGM